MFPVFRMFLVFLVFLVSGWSGVRVVPAVRRGRVFRCGVMRTSDMRSSPTADMLLLNADHEDRSGWEGLPCSPSLQQ